MKQAFSKIKMTLIYLFCKLALYICRKHARRCVHYDKQADECVITDGPCLIVDDYCFDALGQSKSQTKQKDAMEGD